MALSKYGKFVGPGFYPSNSLKKKVANTGKIILSKSKQVAKETIRREVLRAKKARKTGNGLYISDVNRMTDF